MAQDEREIPVTTGIYRHFKGDLYEVIGVGRHAVTDDQLVIYRDTDDRLHARPLRGDGGWLTAVRDRVVIGIDGRACVYNGPRFIKV